MKPHLIAVIVLISAISLTGGMVFAGSHASTGSSTTGGGHGGSSGAHSTATYGSTSSGSHPTAGYGNRVSGGIGARSSGYAGRGIYPSGSSRGYGHPYYSPGRGSTIYRTGSRYPSVSGVTRPANANRGPSLHQPVRVRSNQGQNVAKQPGTVIHQEGNGRDGVLIRQNPRHDQSRLDAKTSSRLRDYKGNQPDFAKARRFPHDHHDGHNGGNGHDGHRGHDGHDGHDGHHCHHDKNWWHNHCPVIVWSGWGWWGWYDGWWYPALGYDPYYSYYASYDPIYSYDGLSPDQIIADVQSALQAEGYYPYAVDGVMGPLTLEALANYQRDHELAVTSAIDEPTLVALGFGN